jgi:hypothetical protein
MDICRKFLGGTTRTQSQSKSQSQSHIATDGQSINKSWCRDPSGAHNQIFITLWQLRSCFRGAPSLTRGQVCLLYMLLVLASVDFLLFESLGTHDRSWPYFTVSDLTARTESEYESYVTTDSQSASLSWNKAPISGLQPDIYYCQTIAGLLMWGALSYERKSLSFATAAGPRQRSHFRVRVPWHSWSYITLSTSRLAFSWHWQRILVT